MILLIAVKRRGMGKPDRDHDQLTCLLMRYSSLLTCNQLKPCATVEYIKKQKQQSDSTMRDNNTIYLKLLMLAKLLCATSHAGPNKADNTLTSSFI